MKQNGGIIYEKPELSEYSLFGVVKGTDPGLSVPGPQPDGCEDPGIDD